MVLLFQNKTNPHFYLLQNQKSWNHLDLTGNWFNQSSFELLCQQNQSNHNRQQHHYEQEMLKKRMSQILRFKLSRSAGVFIPLFFRKMQQFLTSTWLEQRCFIREEGPLLSDQLMREEWGIFTDIQSLFWRVFLQIKR